MTARTTRGALFTTVALGVVLFASTPVLASSTNYNYNHTDWRYHQRPICTVTLAYNAPINGYPTSAKLSWHSQNATTAYLSPDNVSVPLNDTRTVYPYGNTRYAITVHGKGGSYTCETWGTGTQTSYTNSWNQNYYTYPNTYGTPTYPQNQYVYISQLPYTGFDLGPVGNALYFSVLALFALGAAYALFFVLPNNPLGYALMREHRHLAQRLQRLIDSIGR